MCIAWTWTDGGHVVRRSMDPSLGFAVLFLYFTALLIVSLPSGVLKNHRIILQAIQNQNDGENPAMDKNPIRGENDTLSRFMLQKAEISASRIHRSLPVCDLASPLLC